MDTTGSQDRTQTRNAFGVKKSLLGDTNHAHAVRREVIMAIAAFGLSMMLCRADASANTLVPGIPEGILRALKYAGEIAPGPVAVVDKGIVYGTSALIDWHTPRASGETLFARDLGVWQIVESGRAGALGFQRLRLSGMPKARALIIDYYQNSPCVRVGRRKPRAELTVVCRDLAR